MPLGKALGATFSLPQDQGGQMAPASTARAEQPMFPEMKGADQGILEAAPGTAESESYIESIMDLENWLIDAYSQGIRPDKPNLRDPGAIAANKLYRSKVANIKRQAAQLASMKKLNDQVQANIMKGDFYAMGGTGTDPLSGMPMAPTTEDYNRLVSTDIAPMVKAFQGTSPKGNIYDTVGLIDANKRFGETQAATNAYYDDLAAKFPNPQYQQNIEAARQQSMDVLNTLRPMGKAPTESQRKRGDRQKDLEWRNTELEQAKQGVPEVITKLGSQTKYLGKPVSRAEYIEAGTETGQTEDKIRFFTLNKSGSRFKEAELGEVAATDRVALNDILNSRQHFKADFEELEGLAPAEMVEERVRDFTQEDLDNIERIQAGDDSIKDLIKAPGVTKIEYGTEYPFGIGSRSDIIITWDDGTKEEMPLKGRRTREKLRELYKRTKEAGGATSKFDKYKRQ